MAPTFLRLTLMILSLATLFNYSKADLITDICSRTMTMFSKCDNALRSDPRSAGADLWGLGRIALDKAKLATNITLNIAKGLTNGETQDPAAYCVATASIAIYDFDVCKSWLERRDPDVKTWVGDALFHVQLCADYGIGHIRGGASVGDLKNANIDAQDFLAILLLIADSL